jgi:hypothetical protein
LFRLIPTQLFVASITINCIISIVLDPAYCDDENILEYGLGEDEFLNITCNVRANPEPSSYRWVLVNDSVNAHSLALQNMTQQAFDTEEPTLLYQRPSGVPFSKYLHRSCLHTYHSRFIPERVAEVSQIFFRDTHVLPKF